MPIYIKPDTKFKVNKSSGNKDFCDKKFDKQKERQGDSNVQPTHYVGISTFFNSNLLMMR